jgi:DNA-binding SARP family transcriptional activator
LLQLMWIWACRAFQQYERGVPGQALADAQVALNLSERCEDPFVIAHALTTRGRACVRMGMLEEAAGNFVTAIDLFQRMGSRFLAWPLCGLGDLHRIRGQLIQARAAYEKAFTLAEPHHDVFGLSGALIGLARISASDDLRFARDLTARAVQLGEGLRKVPAFLARGWVELIGDDRSRALVYANRAAVAARQRQDNPGLAEAITLGALASSDSPPDVAPLREAVEIWRKTGCCLEEAAIRVVATHTGALPNSDAHFAEHMLREYGVDVEHQWAAGLLGVLASSPPVVFIQTLGEFQVIRDGTPVEITEWKSKKARELLKILVARRRPVSRDQLMGLLWPHVDPAVASNRLSVLLSTVRDVLQPQPTGKEPLVTEDGVVSLNPAEVRIDVEDFLTRAAEAAEADRANEPDATAQLIAAIAAHTGDFLKDDAFQEETAATLAEEVRATHIALLRALSARLHHAGDIDAAIRYTLRLLEQDCYDENAYLNLIAILLDAGRSDQARHHYQNYVRRMAEIDVPPRPLRSMTPHGLGPG